MSTVYSQEEFDEAYEIGKRDGYSDAVQHIDQLTGGDGEYRYCLGMEDDARHTPDPETMIQRIVDRFEVLNLLDDATKTGRDQPDDTPSSSFNRIVEARRKHVDAVAVYNARREYLHSLPFEARFNLDAEYRAMSDAQSEFIKTAQDVADAALSTPTPKEESK
jgi:hypothetical protein